MMAAFLRYRRDGYAIVSNAHRSTLRGGTLYCLATASILLIISRLISVEITAWFFTIV
jgi:hypothetical protein